MYSNNKANILEFHFKRWSRFLDTTENPEQDEKCIYAGRIIHIRNTRSENSQIQILGH